MMRQFTILFISLLLFKVSAAQSSKSTVVKFGNGNQLIVSNKGLYSVKYGAKTIISNASAAYTIEAVKYSTTDYLQRSVKVESLKDEIGAGQLVTLTSTKAGMPTMVQRFFCYRDKGYVVTQVEIRGEHLSSNYMAPLITSNTGVTGSKLQTLFVPFDNDTFIRYKSNDLSDQANISAEVGVVYDGQSRNGLVLGSLEHDNWKSGVKTAGSSKAINQLEVWGGLSEASITRDTMPHGYLKGDKIKSPKMFIGYFTDWRTGLENYAKACKALTPRYVKQWTNATPVGWNSWGGIGTKLNYDNATTVADFFDKQIPAFRNEDGVAYIDLDSYWDNMVRGGLKGDFSKLKEFANYCKQRNLQPGIYWAPFVDWGYQSKNKDRIAEGGNYKFADMWTKTEKGCHDIDGARALDPTHPGTKARIAYVLGKFKECGFTMIKIDFLGHAAAESTGFYDQKITTGMQAYKAGMQTVADVLDNTMLVYAAISPSLATAPYVHMRRIACDAFKSIKDTEYTLNSVSYGWWQTYLYDYIDADHLVFDKETEGANRARLISGLISGPVILGDDYSQAADWQKQIKLWLEQPMLKQLIKSGKAFTPIGDGEAGGGASKTFIRRDATGTYLAIFNYTKQPAVLTVNATKLGIATNTKYQLTEVLGGESLSETNTFTFKFAGEGAYLYKVTTK